MVIVHRGANCPPHSFPVDSTGCIPVPMVVRCTGHRSRAIHGGLGHDAMMVPRPRSFGSPGIRCNRGQRRRWSSPCTCRTYSGYISFHIPSMDPHGGRDSTCAGQAINGSFQPSSLGCSDLGPQRRAHDRNHETGYCGEAEVTRVDVARLEPRRECRHITNHENHQQVTHGGGRHNCVLSTIRRPRATGRQCR